MSEATINSATHRSDSRLSVFDVSKRTKGHPLALYFVYAPDKSLILRGGSQEVSDYCDIHFPVCLYYYSFWKQGQARGHWRANGIGLHERPESKSSFMSEFFVNVPKKAKYVICSDIKDGQFVSPLFYRNVPHKWLPEWNEIAQQWENSRKAEEKERREAKIKRMIVSNPYMWD